MLKIVIDSSSDVEQGEADKLGLELIPMQIRFGEEEFLDGVNISHNEFFEKLIETDELPKTSQINEFRFEECFKKLLKDYDELLVITLSSKLSGTHACAEKAAKKCGGKIYVVDSLNASVGERILLNYALQLVKEGLSAEQIAAKLNAEKSRIKVIAALDTLKYLRKGGRISSVAAIAGEMLSIKPVIGIVEGQVKLLGKAMGSKKSNNLLMQLVEKSGGIDFSMPHALGYSGLSDICLEKYLKDSESLWRGKTENIPKYLIGSTIGTHIGPNAIAVTFFAAETNK